VTDTIELLHSSSLDLHHRLSIDHRNESAGILHDGSALHGGVDLEESLEAKSLGLESNELVGVILPKHLLELRLDHLSCENSDFLVRNLCDDISVVLDVSKDVPIGLHF
jgi:hypothetical protein